MVLSSYNNSKNFSSNSEKKFGKEYCKNTPVIKNPFLGERNLVPNNNWKN